MGLNPLTNRIYFLEHDSEVDRPMLAYLKGDKFSLAVDAGYSASHVRDFIGQSRKNSLMSRILRLSHTGIMTTPLGCTLSTESVLPTIKQTVFSKTSRGRQWTRAISKS